jgi:hypothetical protein
MDVYLALRMSVTGCPYFQLISKWFPALLFYDLHFCTVIYKLIYIAKDFNYYLITKKNYGCYPLLE